VIDSIVDVVAFVGVVALGWCWLRANVHRVAAANGDPVLAARLGELAGRRARSIAVAVIDRHDESRTRFAFIGAEASTRFEIGSVTKALTGMLVAEAVARGELSLDTRVSELVADLAGSELGTVTVRELCTSTCGLPRLPRGAATVVAGVTSGLFGMNPYRKTTPASLLKRASRQRLRNRGRFRYSNLGAAVLGQLLAIAADTDYASLLRERLLAPIGMSDTAVSTPHHTAPCGWSKAGRRHQPWTMGGYAPAGGVYTTIGDLAALAEALLDGSAPGQSSINTIDSNEADKPNRSRGMFWIIDSYPPTDHTAIWHNGQTGGYSAFLALYPHAEQAVVVLASLADATEQQRIALGLTTKRPPPRRHSKGGPSPA
jgi:CubicO group peptidase (beta-lactamase class C family)